MYLCKISKLMRRVNPCWSPVVPQCYWCRDSVEGMGTKVRVQRPQLLSEDPSPLLLSENNLHAQAWAFGRWHLLHPTPGTAKCLHGSSQKLGCFVTCKSQRASSLNTAHLHGCHLLLGWVPLRMALPVLHCFYVAVGRRVLRSPCHGAMTVSLFQAPGVPPWLTSGLFSRRPLCIQRARVWWARCSLLQCTCL